MATPIITYRPARPVYQRISPRSDTLVARVENLLGRLDTQYGQRQNLVVLSRRLRLSGGQYPTPSSPFRLPSISSGLTPFQQTVVGPSSPRGLTSLDIKEGQGTFARGFLGTGVFEQDESGQNVFQRIGTQIGEDVFGLSAPTSTTSTTSVNAFQSGLRAVGDFFFRRNSV
jgi:hypothetical protein